jgi:hypothetical protein
MILNQKSAVNVLIPLVNEIKKQHNVSSKLTKAKDL